MKRMLLFFATMWLGIMGASAQSNKYDLNDDGVVNVTDVIQLVNYILGKENDTHEAVDLGLPSGTKWASFNMGATKPEEYGGHYAWGETEEKDVYLEDTYMYYKNGEYVNIGSDISGTEYDVAHVKWGGNWCMPTKDDIQELLDNCTREWTTLNGVNGMKFTSKINGNSIFLPTTGYRWNDEFDYVGTDGFYWSSTRTPDSSYSAYSLFFYSGRADWSDYGRFSGQSVRPVLKTTPDKAVDLGLPSGTKWASCNVGATSPEEYGGYYAWGETEEKEVYSEDTYIYYKISDDEYVNIGSDISGTKYDVAHVKWGGNWVMPTLDDIKELLDNCTSEWTTLNGVNGMKFTSKINGNSIFLPAAGYRWNDEFDYVGTDGFYWSSTRTPDGSYSAYNLYFFSGLALWYYNGTYRGYGQSVRPVVRN